MRFVLIEVYPIGTRFRFENPIVQIEHQSVDDLNATLPNLASKFALILENAFARQSINCLKYCPVNVAKNSPQNTKKKIQFLSLKRLRFLTKKLEFKFQENTCVKHCCPLLQFTQLHSGKHLVILVPF